MSHSVARACTPPAVSQGGGGIAFRVIGRKYTEGTNSRSHAYNTLPFGQCARKMPSAYVYTSFVSDLVYLQSLLLANIYVNSLTYCTYCIGCIWYVGTSPLLQNQVHITYTNRVHQFQPVTYNDPTFFSTAAR